MEKENQNTRKGNELVFIPYIYVFNVHIEGFLASEGGQPDEYCFRRQLAATAA